MKCESVHFRNSLGAHQRQAHIQQVQLVQCARGQPSHTTHMVPLKPHIMQIRAAQNYRQQEPMLSEQEANDEVILLQPENCFSQPLRHWLPHSLLFHRLA